MNLKNNALNIFCKLLLFEVKRYFSNPVLIIIACIVPILLILSILGSLLPYIFKGAELNDISIAIFNEDPSFETNLIISHLAESDSVEDFVDLIYASSLEEGRRMIDDNEASALVHIPLNMQQDLYNGERVEINFYTGSEDKQIVMLLYDMIEGGLNNINQAQKSVDIIYYAMQDMGYERLDAAAEYREMSENLFVNIISKSDIYIDYNEVSATGDYLNIEYYLISIMLLTMFFLALPIGAKMSKDKFSGVLDRGGFYLHGFSYVSAKIISGAIFLMVPSAVSSVFILWVTGAFGLFSGYIALLAVSVILASFYFAVIMLLIGTISSSTTAAIWAGFSLALAVSSISGIFIPRNLMPRVLTSISEFTGFPAVIILLGHSLFGVRNSNNISDIIIVISIVSTAFILTHLITRRRLIKR